jgi:hypothetical protein
MRTWKVMVEYKARSPSTCQNVFEHRMRGHFRNRDPSIPPATSNLIAERYLKKQERLPRRRKRTWRCMLVSSEKSCRAQRSVHASVLMRGVSSDKRIGCEQQCAYTHIGTLLLATNVFIAGHTPHEHAEQQHICTGTDRVLNSKKIIMKQKYKQIIIVWNK